MNMCHCHHALPYTFLKKKKRTGQFTFWKKLTRDNTAKLIQTAVQGLGDTPGIKLPALHVNYFTDHLGQPFSNFCTEQ